MFNFFKKKTKPKETQEKKLGYPIGPVLGQKGFVNEYACNADIQKYKLQDISPVSQRDLDKGYFHYHLVIDRERFGFYIKSLKRVTLMVIMYKTQSILQVMAFIFYITKVRI